MVTTHQTTEPLTVTHARTHWWTYAFVSPGVNSRGELVPSHGALRGLVGDYEIFGTLPHDRLTMGDRLIWCRLIQVQLYIERWGFSTDAAVVDEAHCILEW
jgi:hypothetical protein